jgi:hypothetical protein
MPSPHAAVWPCSSKGTKLQPSVATRRSVCCREQGGRLLLAGCVLREPHSALDVLVRPGPQPVADRSSSGIAQGIEPTIGPRPLLRSDRLRQRFRLIMQATPVAIKRVHAVGHVYSRICKCGSSGRYSSSRLMNAVMVHSGSSLLLTAELNIIRFFIQVLERNSLSAVQPPILEDGGLV